jgi:hypothetical protein
VARLIQHEPPVLLALDRRAEVRTVIGHDCAYDAEAATGDDQALAGGVEGDALIEGAAPPPVSGP